MSTKDGHPPDEDQAGIGRWPACLPDLELTTLDRQLAAAVRAAVEQPVVDHDLVHAAAEVRLEVRRRRARRKVAAARAALTEAGWTP